MIDCFADYSEFRTAERRYSLRKRQTILKDWAEHFVARAPIDPDSANNPRSSMDPQLNNI